MGKVNLGGDRLGSGNKLEISMHGYERSNHDMSYLWKSTMSAGTLVPFMNLVALPGDTFDIELDAMVRTMPTIGPLFGSFKLQLDVFTIPIRLYNKNLHNNKLRVGMNISEIKFPQIILTGDNIDKTLSTPIEFQQINQSSIFAYLGIRGLAGKDTEAEGITIKKNAIPFLGYWDIFKNYYANKQEEQAYVIHGIIPSITAVTMDGTNIPAIGEPITVTNVVTEWHVTGYNVSPKTTMITFNDHATMSLYNLALEGNPHEPHVQWNTEGTDFLIWIESTGLVGKHITGRYIDATNILSNIKPTLTNFLLADIDDMRDKILAAPGYTPITIDTTIATPNLYTLPIKLLTGETYKMYATMGQEGLAVKTYQSDIFNNWIQTEWIEGTGSIADLTKISTAGNSFTIDSLNIAKKVYDLLNRITISGGSYEDYIEAVYDHNSKWRAETPVYHGGLSKEVIFQEVVSTAAQSGEPLGTLAGKGTMSQKHKGGKLIINIDEPCYIMGIVSLTPRVDYNQGNEWDTNLKTLDDLHKPALDAIGYQDLITEQMAFWDTTTTGETVHVKSAGKQPAWLNYMTNYNKTYGNFADPRSQMFMTLPRRYEMNVPGQIKDLTTYIDPSKFNYAFAQVELSAQNFWVQIANNITARRKMSQKVIPNL